jgi:shikimate kinase
VARVLVTGMSGAGKSTLLRALAARGHLTVDTDHDGWTKADGQWDGTRMGRLLADQPTVVVSGTVDNQGEFYDRFEHVVLLTAPVEVLLARVRGRTTNPYGSLPEHETEIRRYVRDVEPLLRRGATTVLDGMLPVEQLADSVETLMRDSGSSFSAE